MQRCRMHERENHELFSKCEMPQDPRLIVLVRNLAQLEAAITSADRDDLLRIRRSEKISRRGFSLFRNSRAPTLRRSAFSWLRPAYFKMGEEWTLKQVLSSQRGRLSGAQLRSSEIFRRASVAWAIFR